LNGEDLRSLPLVERKARLKRLLRRKLTGTLRRSHRDARPAVIREGLRSRSRRSRRKAEGVPVPGHREAFTVLDQD
jgi:hypothetical protein